MASTHANIDRILSPQPVALKTRSTTQPELQQRSSTPPSLQTLPAELRWEIWKHLLVCNDEVTPRYRVCSECPDRTAQHTGDHDGECIWDPQSALNLYPNILQTCRLFYTEGVHLLYTKNRFTNLLWDDADETAAVFFQSIGEENARRIRSFTVRWPLIARSPAFMYLSKCPNLESLTIQGIFNKQYNSRYNLRSLLRIRAKTFHWLLEFYEPKFLGIKIVSPEIIEKYSKVITSGVVKPYKPNLSWDKITQKVGIYEVG